MPPCNSRQLHFQIDLFGENQQWLCFQSTGKWSPVQVLHKPSAGGVRSARVTALPGSESPIPSPPRATRPGCGVNRNYRDRSRWQQSLPKVSVGIQREWQESETEYLVKREGSMVPPCFSQIQLNMATHRCTETIHIVAQLPLHYKRKGKKILKKFLQIQKSKTIKINWQ